MRIGRRRYKLQSPVRLVVILVVLGALAFVGVKALTGGGSDEASQLGTVADAPCYQGCDTEQPVPYSFPLEGAERDAFVDEVLASGTLATSEAPLLDGYVDNRGRAAAFNAYIPASAASPQDPDYFIVDGQVHVAAIVLPDEDPARFNDIVQTEGEAYDRVILAFPQGSVPTESFVRVYGYLSATTDIVRRDFDPETISSWPVFTVGYSEAVSPSQLRSPALRVYPVATSAAARFPILVMRRENIRMQVDRIEFSADETRVHMTLRNLDASGADSWNPEGASLLVDGKELPVDLEATAGEGDGGPIFDGLDATDLPAAGGDKRLARRGYLVFPPVNQNSGMVLSLPDPRIEGDFVRIEIPAPRIDG